MDINVLVTLLTIAVVMLSIVTIALLAAIVMVVVKVNRIAKNIDATMQNIASASDWLSPVKVVSQITKLFRK